MSPSPPSPDGAPPRETSWAPACESYGVFPPPSSRTEAGESRPRESGSTPQGSHPTATGPTGPHGAPHPAPGPRPPPRPPTGPPCPAPSNRGSPTSLPPRPHGPDGPGA